MRHHITVTDPSNEFTYGLLDAYRKRLPDDHEKRSEFMFIDKLPSGWLAWGDSYDAYTLPTSGLHNLWDHDCQNAVDVFRSFGLKPDFWEGLSVQYVSANEDSDQIQLSEVYCVQSIVQIVGEEVFAVLQPVITRLLEEEDKNKQRVAAQMMLGIIHGSKHWPADNQTKLWEWFELRLAGIFNQKDKDVMNIWSCFIGFLFTDRDPRRYQPVMNHLMHLLHSIDFNGESAFDITKALGFFRSFYCNVGLKGYAWTEDILNICWTHIDSRYEEVLTCISGMLISIGNTMWYPSPSLRTAETVIRESRTLPLVNDLMGVREHIFKTRVMELVESFKIWRDQRVSGPQASHSTYDRVGFLVCSWLFWSLA
ncbi:hypothetical protein QCA50_004906 [Cerrena zonata]|uniref:Proteasome activator complex subunit 4-like HEAT repeat-like domain-containing protein n=1 Tax=Cerrena zonata TaxID=2478898 RepID=A0AAW0GFX4_9APHY